MCIVIGSFTEFHSSLSNMKSLYKLKSKFSIEGPDSQKEYKDQEIVFDSWTQAKMYFYKYSMFSYCCCCFKKSTRMKKLLDIYDKGVDKLEHEFDMKCLAESLRKFDYQILRNAQLIQKNWADQLKAL